MTGAGCSSISPAAWRRRLEAEGLDPAAADDTRFTVAHIFFDTSEDADGQVPRLEEILRDHGFEVLWSGEGTVDRSALGPRASETPPIFWQIACRSVEPGPEASHNCYRAMVAIERDLTCHVASFSANDAVYKVQGQPEVIPRFYPEMGEDDFASARIIAHNRTRRTRTPRSAGCSRSRSSATTARSTRSPSSASRASSSACRSRASAPTPRT